MSHHCVFASVDDGVVDVMMRWSTALLSFVLPVTIMLAAAVYDAVNHMRRFRGAFIRGNTREIVTATGWWMLDTVFLAEAGWLVWAAHRPWAGMALYCIGGTAAWILIRIASGEGWPRVVVSMSGPRTSFSVDW